MTTRTPTIRRAVGALILVVAVLFVGAGAAAAESESAGYLGGSSDQGSVDVNPARVTPDDPGHPQASRALALTGTDVAITLAWTGAAFVAAGLLVIGGMRLIARRR
jgi:hypothetical protein